MPSVSRFVDADLDALVNELKLEDAIALTSGAGLWTTHAVPSAGIPSIKVSDGPNGIRGNIFFMGSPAKAIPSATALGATWDTELIGDAAAKLLADEAKLRAASVILAPTVNIQRSPLGGRSFECFSEDPHLSGLIASAYIANIQAKGIGCCIKHFVGNEMDNDRYAYDSIISPRALREVYLMPYMIAQKNAAPWAYMTAYNRVNGIHMGENPILQDVLRDEWKSDAMIMSDWFGTYSLSESINAGSDLEMPGVGKWRTQELMMRALRSKKITERTIRERAKNVLKLVQKCARGAPEVLEGDGIEKTKDSPEDIQLMRRLAAQSIVLLKNDGGLLPLKSGQLKKVVIIGPNAKARVLSGGGSAALKASYFVSPYEGIVKALPETVEVSYCEGNQAYLTMPTLDRELINEEGTSGWTGSWYSHIDNNFTPAPKPIKIQPVDETYMLISTSHPPEISKRWTLQLRGFLKPRSTDVAFQFGLTVAGRARLFVDGKLLIDNWSKQTRGESFFGMGTVEERGIFQCKAGVSYEVLLELCNVYGSAGDERDDTIPPVGPCLNLGGAEILDGDKAIRESVELAKAADVAIVVVGLNADWETEGYDRTTLALPGRTDELVSEILKVNPKTIVVTQSGSAIEMPWEDSAPAIVHAWYLGNATGDAIADVLFGKVNPSGKLSLTFPKRLQDTPSYGHFASQNGKVRYAEDLFVGYKHYENIGLAPLFAFGHGLSYTTFEYSNLELTQPKPSSNAEDFSVTVTLSIKNTGPVPGSETVQIYISLPPSPFGHQHVPKQLKGFTKVRNLDPGESKKVSVVLDKYAVSYWEEGIERWRAEVGEYVVSVAASSVDVRLVDKFYVSREFEWRGL
ncbi:glycoside hydrolase family 3 protein [Sistotremastrum suecicum HHB10207 ss-3]|uniref:beta-glucosidase n=1 Tax=Sistotremastrum suecicum HHB10207 ss-3 TaxID=1314776 RepID=A0A165ZZR4_9AGAM|nr:glycoside hydrolase family 3 protein [Sistotremastrum suecicum HHB10207 ss-3]